MYIDKSNVDRSNIDGSNIDLQNLRHRIKCVMLGSSGSGKSSIVRRYMVNDFLNQIPPSIGGAFDFKYLKTETGIAKLDIWDTAGQERFDAIMPLYYKHCDIAIIVYDSTSYETFIKAKYWILRIKREVNKEPIFVLIGNKIDLGEHIFMKEAKQYADDNNIKFYECSAKTGHNIQNIFNDTCVDCITENNQNFENNNTTTEANRIKLEYTSSYISQKIDIISSCMDVIKFPFDYIGIFKE